MVMVECMASSKPPSCLSACTRERTHQALAQLLLVAGLTVAGAKAVWLQQALCPHLWPSGPRPPIPTKPCLINFSAVLAR